MNCVDGNIEDEGELVIQINGVESSLLLSVDTVLVISCLNEWILVLSVSVWFLFVVRPSVVVLTDKYVHGEL